MIIDRIVIPPFSIDPYIYIKYSVLGKWTYHSFCVAPNEYIIHFVLHSIFCFWSALVHFYSALKMYRFKISALSRSITELRYLCCLSAVLPEKSRSGRTSSTLWHLDSMKRWINVLCLKRSLTLIHWKLESMKWPLLSIFCFSYNTNLIQ